MLDLDWEEQSSNLYKALGFGSYQVVNSLLQLKTGWPKGESCLCSF